MLKRQLYPSDTPGGVSEDVSNNENVVEPRTEETIEEGPTDDDIDNDLPPVPDDLKEEEDEYDPLYGDHEG